MLMPFRYLIKKPKQGETMETETIKETKINQYHLDNEIEFKKNKHNINVILTGDNKYYYANQCAEFTKNVMKYGYENITSKQLKEKGVCFNKYSINNGYNQYCRDIKRFSNKHEMLGFVIGYNQAIEHKEVA
jgi:hypothetical protein